jgi:hypothetical protein
MIISKAASKLFHKSGKIYPLRVLTQGKILALFRTCSSPPHQMQRIGAVARALGLNIQTFAAALLLCNQMLTMGGGGLEPSPRLTV